MTSVQIQAGPQALEWLAPERRQGQSRRALNVAVAVLAIILTAPLMLIIAIVVRLTSPGPVIFRQTRVGLDRRNSMGDAGNRRRYVDVGGRPFTIFKFRTMDASAGNPDDQVWARPDDPRVTTTGRILRKYRLDELPQLFNVLCGTMNLVGPRPEQPGIFRNMRNEVDQYQQRQQVLPGITGWAQINQHYDSSIEDVQRKVGLDLEYLARCSASEDLRIMLKTLPVVAFKRGAW